MFPTTQRSKKPKGLAVACVFLLNVTWKGFCNSWFWRRKGIWKCPETGKRKSIERRSMSVPRSLVTTFGGSDLTIEWSPHWDPTSGVTICLFQRTWYVWSSKFWTTNGGQVCWVLFHGFTMSSCDAGRVDRTKGRSRMLGAGFQFWSRLCFAGGGFKWTSDWKRGPQGIW